MEAEDFDFDTSKLGEPLKVHKPMPSLKETFEERKKMTWDERSRALLSKVHDFCLSCALCELGTNYCTEHDTDFDPHVFSNMQPSKWMIVGQNPGYNECLEREPFVGDAGKIFNRALERHGIKRDDFYISNMVKCHTVGNAKPTWLHKKACLPILQMELGILRPKLVVTLGAVALDAFCPSLVLSSKGVMGKVHKSEVFEGVKIFPIYHPSPRNLSSKSRAKEFKRCINLLCKVIIASRSKK